MVKLINKQNTKGFQLMSYSSIRQTGRKVNYLLTQPQSQNSKYLIQDFTQQMISIYRSAVKLKTNQKDNRVYASATEVYSYKWLANHKELVPNAIQSMLQRHPVYPLSKSPVHQIPDYLLKRANENTKIINQNLKQKQRDFKISYFQKPVETPVTKVSRDRLEFSQYQNEVLQVLGRISDLREDVDTHQHHYVKLLLTNVQYLPANPKYGIYKSMFLPDHLWLDITDSEMEHQHFQKDDYIGITGIVSEYQSRVVEHKFKYWRTKYSLSHPQLEALGQPVINETTNRITELKFDDHPDRILQQHPGKTL